MIGCERYAGGVQLRYLAAIGVLAGVAACGGHHSLTGSGQLSLTGRTGRLPSCTTSTVADGSTVVMRLHTTGSAFTGTDVGDGNTATIGGQITAPGRISGFLDVDGYTFRFTGSYTSTSVTIIGSSGQRVFTNSHGCPP